LARNFVLNFEKVNPDLSNKMDSADAVLEQVEPDRRNRVDKIFRLGFVSMSIQLALAASSVAAFTLVEDAKEYAGRRTWIQLSSGLSALVLLLFLVILSDCFRSKFRFVSLGGSVFIVLSSVCIGSCATYGSSEAILFTSITCLLVSLTSTLFTFQNCLDISQLRNIGWVLLTTILVLALSFGIAAAFFAGTVFFT
jgi:hypothetical protein